MFPKYHKALAEPDIDVCWSMPRVLYAGIKRGQSVAERKPNCDTENRLMVNGLLDLLYRVMTKVTRKGPHTFYNCGNDEYQNVEAALRILCIGLSLQYLIF